jgi:hypothetical protein
LGHFRRLKVAWPWLVFAPAMPFTAVNSNNITCNIIGFEQKLDRLNHVFGGAPAIKQGSGGKLGP